PATAPLVTQPPSRSAVKLRRAVMSESPWHSAWGFSLVGPPFLRRPMFRMTIPSAGVDSMSGQHRSVFLASLLPAFLAVGVFAAQEGRAQAAGHSLWSDPATWPNAKVPVAGDKVVIARDKEVVLDVSPPA